MQNVISSLKKSFSRIFNYVKISSFIHPYFTFWYLYHIIYKAQFSTLTTVRTIIFHYPWFVQVFTGAFIVSQSFIEPILVCWVLPFRFRSFEGVCDTPQHLLDWNLSFIGWIHNIKSTGLSIALSMEFYKICRGVSHTPFIAAKMHVRR